MERDRRLQAAYGRRSSLELLAEQTESSTQEEKPWMTYVVISLATASYLLVMFLLYAGDGYDPELTAIYQAEVPRHVYVAPILGFGTAFLLNLMTLMVERATIKFQMAFMVCYINLLAATSDWMSFMGMSPVFKDAWGHQAHLGRVVMWLWTTPVMVYLLSLISDFSPRKMMTATASDIALISLLLMAMCVGSKVLYVLLIAPAVVLFAYVMYTVWIMFDAPIATLDNLTAVRSLQLVRGFTLVTWVCFPVLYFSCKFGLLSRVTEELLWGVCDFVGKVIFSSSLLQSNFLTIRERRAQAMRLVEEARQRQVIEELQELVEQKEQFLSGMSHELRTPLNGIIGLSDALLVGCCGTISDQARKTVFTIKSSGTRLLNLINDILDASSLRQGTLVIKHERVQLRKVADDIVDLMMPLVRTNVQLLNQVPRDLPPVLGDTGRILQILHNLVGNACKFTHKGQICVGATPKDEQVELFVQDTGIGIPSDKLSSIFQAFQQVDMSTTRKYGGTGLGLTLVQELVLAHGGSITVKSRPGVGSTFTVTFKVWDPAVNERLSIDSQASSVGKPRTLLSQHSPLAGSHRNRFSFQQTSVSTAGTTGKHDTSSSDPSGGSKGGVSGKLVVVRGPSRPVPLPTKASQAYHQAKSVLLRRAQSGLAGLPSTEVIQERPGGEAGVDDELQGLEGQMDLGEEGVYEIHAPSVDTRSQSRTGSGSGVIAPGVAGPSSGSAKLHHDGVGSPVATAAATLAGAAGGAAGGAAVVVGGGGSVRSAAGVPQVSSEIVPLVGYEEPLPAGAGTGSDGRPASVHLIDQPLPLALVTSPRVAQQQQAGQPQGTASQSQLDKVVHVLSVDDDPINQMVIENLLAPEGFKISKAMDGQSALAMLEEWPCLPDIILLDVMMPGMSGYEVCRKLRDLYPHACVPVIMVSAKSKEEDIVQGLATGANDYLIKPFGRQEILARIHAHLRYKDNVIKAMAETAAEDDETDIMVTQALSETWQELLGASSKQFSLPASIKSLMENSSGLVPLLQILDDLTLVVIGINNLSSLAETIPLPQLMGCLASLHIYVGELLEQYNAYMVDSMEDRLLIITGLSGERITDQVATALNLSRDLLQLADTMTPSSTTKLLLSVGIHSCTATGVVVGVNHPVLHVTGALAEKAAQLQATCPPGCIHVSQAVFEASGRPAEFVSGMMPGHAYEPTYLHCSGAWSAHQPSMVARYEQYVSDHPFGPLNSNAKRLRPVQLALFTIMHCDPGMLVEIITHERSPVRQHPSVSSDHVRLPLPPHQYSLRDMPTVFHDPLATTTTLVTGVSHFAQALPDPREPGGPDQHATSTSVALPAPQAQVQGQAHGQGQGQDPTQQVQAIVPVTSTTAAASRYSQQPLLAQRSTVGVVDGGAGGGAGGGNGNFPLVIRLQLEKESLQRNLEERQVTIDALQVQIDNLRLDLCGRDSLQLQLDSARHEVIELRTAMHQLKSQLPMAQTRQLPLTQIMRPPSSAPVQQPSALGLRRRITTPAPSTAASRPHTATIRHSTASSSASLTAQSAGGGGYDLTPTASSARAALAAPSETAGFMRQQQQHHHAYDVGRDVRTVTSPSIHDLLDSVNLGHLTAAFEREEVTPDVVPFLDDAALVELGVRLVGERVRLRRAAELL